MGIVKDAALFTKAELGQVQDDQILEKEKHSLVSYVDIETEKKLVTQLRLLLPEADYITEENTTDSLPPEELKWIIDPLDRI